MAKIEHAVVVLRVAAMEGVGKGRLSGSSGSNNDDPWVGKVWDKRPLPFGKRYDKQEQRCCSHGDETNTTAEDKLIIEEGFARLNVHIETYHKYISAPAQVHLCKRG